MDCIFCKIIQRKIPANIVFEDDDVLAFSDMNAAAPHHYLVIPKKHIATLNDIEVVDSALVGKLPLTAAHIARSKNFAEAGYRVVMNCNADAGQSVFHIHMHVLAGRSLAWPPG